MSKRFRVTVDQETYHLLNEQATRAGLTPSQAAVTMLRDGLAGATDMAYVPNSIAAAADYCAAHGHVWAYLPGHRNIVPEEWRCARCKIVTQQEPEGLPIDSGY